MVHINSEKDRLCIGFCSRITNSITKEQHSGQKISADHRAVLCHFYQSSAVPSADPTPYTVAPYLSANDRRQEEPNLTSQLAKGDLLGDTIQPDNFE